MMGAAEAYEEQNAMEAEEHLADHPKARKYRIATSDINTEAELPRRMVGIYQQEFLYKALSTHPMP